MLFCENEGIGLRASLFGHKTSIGGGTSRVDRLRMVEPLAGPTIRSPPVGPVSWFLQWVVLLVISESMLFKAESSAVLRAFRLTIPLYEISLEADVLISG